MTSDIKEIRDMRFLVKWIYGGNINRCIHDLQQSVKEEKKMNNIKRVVLVNVDLKLLMEMQK